MRVVQVLASIDDPGAGPSTSVARLAGELGNQGAKVILRSVADWRSRQGDAPTFEHDGAYTVCRSPLDQNRLASLICGSTALKRALNVDAHSFDVLHSHGLWLMPNVYPGWAVQRKDSQAKFILSPRGMLGGAALEFSRMSKRAFWAVAQKRAIAAASVLHATSEAEVEEIRDFGIRIPVAMIPNGVDLPDDERANVRRASEVLYLGRLHPKKGIDTLVEAWAQVAPQHPEWTLRIVGPSEGGYAEVLQGLVTRLSAPRIRIEGPAYGGARAACYRQASLFVLPTRNENFAMVVAEALAAGMPVIATKGAPWADLGKEGCGWWVDYGVQAIVAALEVAMSSPPETLAAMGARGRGWMQREYSWRRVAEEMRAVYSWARHGGPAPATMRFH